MAYRTRLILFMVLDSLIVSTAIYVAAWIVYPYETLISLNGLIFNAVTLLIFHHIFAIIYKLYRTVWAYASVGELLIIVKSVTLSIIAVVVVQLFMNDFVIYKRALVVTWMLHILLIGGSRFIWRIIHDSYVNKGGQKNRTLIIGAGSAGAMIARQLVRKNNSNLMPVGFVDDSDSKQKMQLYNLPILGRTKDIPNLVKNYAIDHLIIAIPSLSQTKMNEIVSICHQTKAKIQIIPKVEDLLTGKVSVTQLKDVEVEDLLGREPVEIDLKAIRSFVTDQTVMVTGAGGSIGAELCRQIVKFLPKKIVLVGHGEYSIYKIHLELEAMTENMDIDLIPVIADIKDRQRMYEIIRTYQPITIYHAAAHKHVPLMEYNPHEAVKNNVLGTKNVAEMALTCGVKTFVLISSDKAVNPKNVMGATKRMAEMIVQALNGEGKTRFTAVRFGNVLGSRGSVIPLFKRQIQKGGPITITDPKMTRYFMTVSEAARLVLQASTLAKEGEVFVLDMGRPVKIVDLAKKLIKLSGYHETEIPIHYTGKRPGEKLHEELMNEDELMYKIYEKIYVGRTKEIDEAKIERFIEQFMTYSEEELKEEIMSIVASEQILLQTKR